MTRWPKQQVTARERRRVGRAGGRALKRVGERGAEWSFDERAEGPTGAPLA